MRVWINAVISVMIVMFMLSGCETASAEMKTGNALFSWSHEVLEEQDWDQVFEQMQKQNLSILYQAIPEEVELDTLEDFLQKAVKQDILVYMLAGEPEWGLDSAGAQMQAEVKRVAAYNKRLPQKCRIQGILMDTEPYLTKDWKKHKEKVMKKYVSGMKKTHSAAQKAELQLVACIPYYYDTEGLEKELQTLIVDGCDGLAIMNYYKEDEALHIETEMTLAKQAGIPVTVIYELQKPDQHDLIEKNTYYHDGLGAVLESVKRLETHFGTGRFTYAIHDYDALQEVIEHE